MAFNIIDLVRKVIAHNAKPSYNYFGGYFNGSYLHPHTDRPQCEFTLSLTIEQNPPNEAWPLGIWKKPLFERDDSWPGRDKEPWPEEKELIWADLLANDGLLFMGRHMLHFRKGILTGKERWVNQIFIHHVPEYFNGLLD